MAIVPSKATVLKLTISAVLTAIAQLRNLTIGGQDPGVFVSRVLAGDPFSQSATGFVDQSDITGDYFYDPNNATHQFIAACTQTPLTIGNEVDGTVTMADTGTTVIPFTAAAIAPGDTVFTMEDGVVQSFVIKPDSLVELPTS